MLTAQGGKGPKNPAIIGTALAFIPPRHPPPPPKAHDTIEEEKHAKKQAVSVSTTVFAAAAEFTSSNGGTVLLPSLDPPVTGSNTALPREERFLDKFLLPWT